MRTLFEAETFKITKPIRLIELFGGVGSQAMALRNIGADFEHYRLVEVDKYAVKSYNAIHGTNFRSQDIKEIHAEDLSITETNKYCYIMCYSFPCQDLSLAGLRHGMKKGSNTRSGLLWEVERILEESKEKPQVLLMENVVQVHRKKNITDFNEWMDFLKSKGYQNFYQDLNAKDYGIPQNRVRCFMVSILSNGYVEYEFPEKTELKIVMKDLLEDIVDEKYYFNNEKAKKLMKQIIMNDKKETIDLTINKPEKITVANCICAKDRGIADRKKKGNGVLEEMKISVIAKSGATNALSIIQKDYRIRKLTPMECWRLMGFSDADFDKASAINSNTQLYKQAGNAIVVNVLMNIFNQML